MMTQYRVKPRLRKTRLQLRRAMGGHNAAFVRHAEFRERIVGMTHGLNQTCFHDDSHDFRFRSGLRISNRSFCV